LQKTSSKQTEPPTGLPIEAIGGASMMGGGEPPASDSDSSDNLQDGFNTDSGDLGYDGGPKFG
jgi:hypothetical protein